MARKPRIEILGYYYIVNRGVEQRVVFYDKDDFEYFIKLLARGCERFNIVLHNFCLMNNHYHLLIEIEDETLSKFMRHLNSNYAIYFNKKYKRSGHLWQGRFKSWYVANETYLYILMRYIEQNPLKAKMVDKINHYPYSSSHYFLKPGIIPNFLQNAWIVQPYQNDIESIETFFNSQVDIEDLQELKKASSLVVSYDNDKTMDEVKLIKLFEGITGKEERNRYIIKAYNEGYSQHMIAKVIGISQPAIYGVIKRNER
jgi:REP element-mobilizing transposase RayT